MAWLQFAMAAGAVLVAGHFIVRYADDLGRETGLGRVWAGVLLLATATSLPELATGIGAVRIAGEPNLAAGGVFGSNVFNLGLAGALALRPAWRQLIASPLAEETKWGGVGAALMLALILAQPVIAQRSRAHIVQKGETLSEIALQYGTDIQTLRSMNGLENENLSSTV